jgi:hypothetical protein
MEHNMRKSDFLTQQLIQEKDLYRKALERIARCDENDCERYVRKVDDITCEALARGDEFRDH